MEAVRKGGWVPKFDGSSDDRAKNAEALLQILTGEKTKVIDDLTNDQDQMDPAKLCECCPRATDMQQEDWHSPHMGHLSRAHTTGTTFEKADSTPVLVLEKVDDALNLVAWTLVMSVLGRPNDE